MYLYNSEVQKLFIPLIINELKLIQCYLHNLKRLNINIQIRILKFVENIKYKIWNYDV